MVSRGLCPSPSPLSVSWRLSSAPSLSPSLSPFFLGLYSSDLLTPHFSDTLHPLPSPAYLTPHLSIAHLSIPSSLCIPLPASHRSPPFAGRPSPSLLSLSPPFSEL